MRPEAVLTGVTVLWGSTFIVTKQIVRDASPLLFLTFRFGVAALVMALVCWRRFPPTRRAVVDGMVIGLLNGLGLVLQVFGQVYTTASKSAFITSLNTPLTPLVALLLYRLRPSRPQLAAVVLATLGLLLLTYPTGGARWNGGDLLTVGCSLVYAFVIVEIAHRSPGHDVLVLTTIQLVAQALLASVAAFVAHTLIATLPPAQLPELLRVEARPLVLAPRLVLEVAYMAIVCSAVTFTAQTWAMARMSATHAAVIFALEPVFATAMAVGVDGSSEWPGARGLAGAVLVMVGVLVSEIRLPWRRPDA
jgi:drug/metabolite transporter (DMT)-like permease